MDSRAFTSACGVITIRVSAPAYQTHEGTMRIRPDNDYPDVAGSYGARLTCKTCTSYYQPISCSA